MSHLSAVRGLEPQLKKARLNVLLIDIQSDVGQALLDRFEFRATPTFILYASDQSELWRGYNVPTLDQIVGLLKKQG